MTHSYRAYERIPHPKLRKKWRHMKQVEEMHGRNPDALLVKLHHWIADNVMPYFRTVFGS